MVGCNLKKGAIGELIKGERLGLCECMYSVMNCNHQEARGKLVHEIRVREIECVMMW